MRRETWIRRFVISLLSLAEDIIAFMVGTGYTEKLVFGRESVGYQTKKVVL